MRRALIFVSALSAFALVACGPKFKNGECETSEHCKEQEGFGKVCVQGRCQECGADTDCKAGFVCRGNKCEPRPECETSADCSGGKACQDGKCVAVAPTTECDASRPCAAGQECTPDGRCVAKVAAPGPCDVLQSVHFGFDESTLTAEARSTLEADAKCLKESPAKLTVEGNCDERGTSDYNMHLGQRRADSVKKYLGGLGVPAKSISTVSYGKERPSCRESNEECWAKNRRADLKK